MVLLKIIEQLEKIEHQVLAKEHFRLTLLHFSLEVSVERLFDESVVSFTNPYWNGFFDRFKFVSILMILTSFYGDHYYLFSTLNINFYFFDLL